MGTLDLVGLQEVAVMGGVTPSAVVNWRKRFNDFPTPLADLKSGPVWRESTIRAWLSRRPGKELLATVPFYDQLAAKRGDDADLIAAVDETVSKLIGGQTDTRRPGMLLGKIQSGKTRAYLGIIARAFDRGYDIAVVLTKGTKSLGRQTISRLKKDFSDFIEADQVQVYDIMALPTLTPFELNQKLILVVKKEDDNLDRVLLAFEKSYPALQARRLLIVDDEADLASVSARRKQGVVGVGTISGQIEKLRALVPDSDFLQVTATPYALYLQPDDDVVVDGNTLLTPRRPTFTVILPTHGEYVGGDYYFEKSTDPESPAYFFYREVPLEEREALKKEDRRRLRIENILSEQRAAVLRDAVLTFLAGGCVRRLQAARLGQRPQKYSFLFHTEQTRSAHEWQERLAIAIRDNLVAEAKADTPRFNELLQRTYADLRRSIQLQGSEVPTFDAMKNQVADALANGELMITKVNSDKDIDELLDENGQLKLRNPFNLFIGGQILDRGITINNLIAFYYGRNPKRFQQDTVLQHSRMYGARSMADLAVTRFYAPLHVYHQMKKIHAFDTALREAFESGAHDRGVYFVQKDQQNRTVPCAPNKLAFSNVLSVRPGKRLLPTGFDTKAKSVGAKALEQLDSEVNGIAPNDGVGVLVPLEKAVELMEKACAGLEFEEGSDDECRSLIAALEHFSRISKNPAEKGKVWLITARDRDVARYREEGRFSDAPDTKQQADVAKAKALDVPALMLLRQNGTEAKQWRGLPFWWPVIVTPQNAVTSIFATDRASHD